ncbi:transcriptional regulator [Planctomycetota bacterium]|nr:transcriptional regulator [Planctomycetota bacterium]
MHELDKVIHQPARLKIMAMLNVLPGDADVDFVYVRDELKMTDGNLGSHLTKLEDAGYVRIKKVFEGKKPRTYLKLTGKGRDRFMDHVAALKNILG